MRELGLVMDAPRGLNNVNRAFHFIDRPRKRTKTSETGYGRLADRYLSPSAELKPGQRTGKFRLGNDQLLVDATGQSKISVQDYAVAMIDELERPTHVRQRFTAGY